MALKLKKENESLKISLATAEEKLQDALARASQDEGGSEGTSSNDVQDALLAKETAERETQDAVKAREDAKKEAEDAIKAREEAQREAEDAAKAKDSAEKEAQDSKAELLKLKKLAMGLKKKNTQLTEQLEKVVLGCFLVCWRGLTIHVRLTPQSRYRMIRAWSL